MDRHYTLYEPDERFYKRSRYRFGILFLVFVILILLVISSVLYLQFSKKYRECDELLSVRWEDVIPSRGTIYADNGQVLAVDILRFSLSFDPDATGLCQKDDSIFFLENVEGLSHALSTVFHDRSQKEYYQLLTTSFKNQAKGNVILGDRKITAGELGQLKSMSPLMNIDRNKSGIIVQTFYHREYPNGNVAKRTVGLKNDSAAFTGLEKTLDDILSGTKGTQKVVRVTKDIWRPQYDVKNVEVKNGWDVMTTINVKLQSFVQEALANQVVAMKAEWGTAIVLDVKTADVKAVANVTFDHASGKVQVEKYDGEFYAIHRRLEPGSTFKTVSLMCMLDDESAHISLSEKFNTKNVSSLGENVSISDDHDVGTASVQEILEQSSNIGMAMIAKKYYYKHPDKLISRVEETGIYNPLDLIIPTSIRPIHYRYKSAGWSYDGFYKMTFGYTVNMTPMHIATFYNGLANGGVMLSPRFVTHFENSRNHQTMDTIPVRVLNPKMCSDETLGKVKRCLEGVVTRGTGRLTVGPAKFKCAGKTGTAKLSYGKAGYDGNKIKYYASFVGYFPADNPRYTVLVGIETHLDYPRQRQYSGALVAGPTFREIADFIYEYENSSPKIDVSKAERVDSKGKVVTAVGEYEKLESTATKLGVDIHVANGVGKFCGVDSLGTVIREVSSDSIPNLSGFAVSDAMRLLHGKGYSVTVIGEGVVQRAEYNGKSVKLYLK